MKEFVSKKELVKGFANAMNLVSPEVENHHEKVAYIAYSLADRLGMGDKEKQLVLLGALLHDIGGVLKQGNISLLDLEMNARQVSAAGSYLLKMFPVTKPFSEVVLNSQNSWLITMIQSTAAVLMFQKLPAKNIRKASLHSRNDVQDMRRNYLQSITPASVCFTGGGCLYFTG